MECMQETEGETEREALYSSDSYQGKSRHALALKALTYCVQEALTFTGSDHSTDEQQDFIVSM